eukprot:scaffold11189_cov54-Phaeocystis_antarctica.AAC.3
MPAALGLPRAPSPRCSAAGPPPPPRLTRLVPRGSDVHPPRGPAVRPPAQPRPARQCRRTRTAAAPGRTVWPAGRAAGRSAEVQSRQVARSVAVWWPARPPRPPPRESHEGGATPLRMSRRE